VKNRFTRIFLYLVLVIFLGTIFWFIDDYLKHVFYENGKSEIEKYQDNIDKIIEASKNPK
jgi:hypothetical protein